MLYDKETNTPEEIGASYIPADIARGTFLEKRDVVPKLCSSVSKTSAASGTGGSGGGEKFVRHGKLRH